MIRRPSAGPIASAQPQAWVRAQPGGGAAGRRCAVAFTLVGTLIVVAILAIVAAIVVPRFSSAAHITRENTLKDDLRYLRTQIGVYKATHQDFPPGYQNGAMLQPVDQTFIAQMTQFTDVAGNVSATSSATFQYGPYLMKMPPNPLTGLTTIKIALNPAAMIPDNSTGWIYDPLTQDIIANTMLADSDGMAYAQY